MAKIKTNIEYEAVIKRIEELAPLFDDTTPLSSPIVIEYRLLSDLAEEYEEKHYPIGKSTILHGTNAINTHIAIGV